MDSIKRYFGFQEAGTDLRTELLAGVTTFLTMAYIIFVNPAILGDAGMPKDRCSSRLAWWPRSPR